MELVVDKSYPLPQQMAILSDFLYESVKKAGYRFLEEMAFRVQLVPPEVAGGSVAYANKGHIFINRESLHMFSSDEVFGIFLHECIHITSKHLDLAASLGINTGIDHYRFNIASDILINELLESKGFKVADGCMSRKYHCFPMTSTVKDLIEVPSYLTKSSAILKWALTTYPIDESAEMPADASPPDTSPKQYTPVSFSGAVIYDKVKKQWGIVSQEDFTSGRKWYNPISEEEAKEKLGGRLPKVELSTLRNISSSQEEVVEYGNYTIYLPLVDAPDTPDTPGGPGGDGPITKVTKGKDTSGSTQDILDNEDIEIVGDDEDTDDTDTDNDNDTDTDTEETGGRGEDEEIDEEIDESKLWEKVTEQQYTEEDVPAEIDPAKTLVERGEVTPIDVDTTTPYVPPDTLPIITNYLQEVFNASGLTAYKNKVTVKRDYSKISRRAGGYSKGIIVPGSREVPLPAPRVCFLLDVSGSMSYIDSILATIIDFFVGISIEDIKFLAHEDKLFDITKDIVSIHNKRFNILEEVKKYRHSQSWGGWTPIDPVIKGIEEAMAGRYFLIHITDARVNEGGARLSAAYSKALDNGIKMAVVSDNKQYLEKVLKEHPNLTRVYTSFSNEQTIN